MKALSYIVASILMLIITVALSGTAYLYMSGVFTAGMQGIEIADSYCNRGLVTMKIRNIGTSGITRLDVEQSSPSYDFSPSWQGNLEPGKTASYKDICVGTTSRNCIYRLSPSQGKTVTATIQCSGNPYVSDLGASINEGEANLYYTDSYGVNQDETFAAMSNWEIDEVNNKYSFEFYVDNDLEETVSAIEISDENQASVWGGPWGGGEKYDTAGEKIKGSNSLYVNLTRNAATGIWLQFGAYQDWINYDFIMLWIKGDGSGRTLDLRITDDSDVDIYDDKDGTWRVGYSIILDFTGWRRFVISFKEMTVQVGVPVWSQVRKIILYSGSVTNFIFYLDRVTVDVGQWVKVESFVPDNLELYYNFGTQPHVRLFSWDGSQYRLSSRDAQTDNLFITEGVQGSSFPLYFLDGTEIGSVYGSPVSWNCKASGIYWYGKREETKNLVYNGGGGAPISMTYSSSYGVENRIGFAIKMPPDDGQDNSTYGISQTKLKMEVYYQDPGTITYEYSDGTSYQGDIEI